MEISLENVYLDIGAYRVKIVFCLILSDSSNNIRLVYVHKLKQ